MKFVMIGPIYPYRGGIAHYTSQLSRALIENGHETHIFSFRRQYPGWLYPGKSDKEPSQPQLQLEAKYTLDPIYPWTWLNTSEAIEKLNPDAVIIQWWTTFWAPAFTFLSHKFRQKSIPVLFLIHNVLPHEQKPWDRILAKTALRQGDIFIVQTEHEADRLQDLIPGANLVICSHPVYNMFSAAGFPKPDAKNLLGISPDQKVLLFFGIVRPYKGLETLIHALALLHPRGIKPTLIVAGEFWQDKSSLLNLIEKVNIMEQVLIEDRYILDQEIPTYFSAADIFVAPYRKGTQSGAVKLALGFNLPVVLSQTIADPAILNLENYPVYIMPPDDPIELANSLEIAIRDLKEKTGVSPGSKDSGWDELVRVIEDSVLEFDHPDEKDI